MTEGAPTISEGWFDAYLESHGYTFERHPDLGTTKHPDRLIERGGIRAVCEIKQFEKDPLDGVPSGQAVFIDEHKPVRGAVKQAADQLRPLKGRGLPLVVVLANPKGYFISLDGKSVAHALYGDDTVQIPVYLGEGPIPPDFPHDDYRFIAGRNGQIRNVGQYISAVVVLHRRLNEDDFFAQRESEFVEDYKRRNPGKTDPADMLHEGYKAATSIPDHEIPTGEYFFVEAIPAISEQAVPLPDAFFDGPNDRRWAYDRDAEIMERVK